MIIKGKFVDIAGRRIFPAEIVIQDKRIRTIQELSATALVPDQYICPGFIDAHVHIESSMLIPSEFARLAVVHGTVATVSDPHEIANVLGMAGVDYMIDNAAGSPFYFYFGAPSCVPATIYETAGASLFAEEVDQLLSRPGIWYLSEMMNFPGVLQGDEEVKKKIASAKKYRKPIDGHAPGLRGEEARKYIDAGISTDHECYTAEEALDKLSMGMKILIREGSAARNFEALAPLLSDHWENMMFCSDDKHPDSLVKSHINELCARARKKNIDLFKILRVACINPINHYQLDLGQLRTNDYADFIILKDLEEFEVLQTWLRGELVSENGITYLKSQTGISTPNQFNCLPTTAAQFAFKSFPDENAAYPFPAIEAYDGEIITGKYAADIKPENGYWKPDVKNDILKIVVVNRYRNAPVAMAFIKNFGLKSGAIASSVAHDSHNIVAVGVDDESISMAVNAIISKKGGISVASHTSAESLGLPVAGLMSNEDGYQVAERYTRLDAMARQSGSGLQSPFMTLSFMALLVIPHLKISDLGLFDGDRFSII